MQPKLLISNWLRYTIWPVTKKWHMLSYSITCSFAISIVMARPHKGFKTSLPKDFGTHFKDLAWFLDFSNTHNSSFGSNKKVKLYYIWLPESAKIMRVIHHYLFHFYLLSRLVSEKDYYGSGGRRIIITQNLKSKWFIISANPVGGCLRSYGGKWVKFWEVLVAYWDVYGEKVKMATHTIPC